MLFATALPLPAAEDFVFAEGTPCASPGFVIESGAEGPTVLCIASPSTTDPRATEYLNSLRGDSLKTGRLVVVPRFNLPDEKDRGALRRAFPTEAGEEIPLDSARALWEALQKIQPDYLVTVGSAGTPRASTGSRNHYGNTILHGGTEGLRPIAVSCVAAANGFVRDPALRWTRLANPARGGLTRAAADALGIHSLVINPARRGVTETDSRNQTLAAIHGLLETAGLRERPRINHAQLGAGKLRVAVYLDQGVGGNGPWNIRKALADGQPTYVAFVNAIDVRNGVLDDFHVAVFPGGSARAQGGGLGEKGRRQVVEFVRHGGGYFGVCAGAYLGCSNSSPGGSVGRLGLVNAKTISPQWRRGRGRVDLEMTPVGIEKLGAEESKFDVRYANGPVVEPAGIEDLPAYHTLAYYRTELAENNTPEGIMVDSPALLAGAFGKGRVILFSPHPESDEHLRHLVRNAVDWVAETQKEN